MGEGAHMKFEPGEINIICSDVQSSLQFYRDILEFTPERDEEGFYHLHFGKRQYLLLPFAQPSPQIAGDGTIPQFSMDLIVADIKAAYEYFKEHGVAFAQEWQEGEVMFVVRDPDGLPWEIIQSGI
jgi:catechol 2,3-dioxygenase-like lactoylglutathione lyase family enzyme